MPRRVVIAIDATERSLDPLALGKVLAECSATPVVLGSVFPYHPLADPTGEELTQVREEARGILMELAADAGVDAEHVQVVASNLAARELQRVTEEETTAVIVVGSTSRGPIGRLLVGGVGERLLAGSACPVAVAPRGYAERQPERLERIGVAFNGSEESRRAMEGGRQLARACGGQVRVLTAFESVPLAAQATLVTGGATINELLRNQLRENLDDLVAEQSEGLAVEGRFIEGPAGQVLAKESADLDLLVTGSRGYGPHAAVMLGTVTHTLMREAQCPVLILPRGTALDLGQ